MALGCGGERLARGAGVVLRILRSLQRDDQGRGILWRCPGPAIGRSVIMARRPLTVFGKAVWVMMAERGIVDYSDLRAFLREHGYDFKTDTLGNWLTGRTSESKDF